MGPSLFPENRTIGLVVQLNFRCLILKKCLHIKYSTYFENVESWYFRISTRFTDSKLSHIKMSYCLVF